MTREEARANGYELHETKHSMKRRSPWHNYKRKGTYMVTLVVKDRLPLLGELVGRADAEANVSDIPHIKLSPLGEVIMKEELQKISRYYPQVEVWKVCVMPDHIHMIVRVKEDLEEGKHIGLVLAGFKSGCSKAAMRLGVTVPCASVQGNKTQGGHPGNGGAVIPLFETGYNDKILLHDGQLDNWKRYLDDNPRRLLMKRNNPHLFTVLSDMSVAGEKCQIVGNRFLLDIPDKVAVIVHRRYSEEDKARLMEEWLACGERGGVLVSAAISPAEKAVLREAMNRSYSIILLRENGFPELYKPIGESFDACAKGHLLQISPWEYHMEQKTITRQQCLHLNVLAEKIVNI